MIQVLGLDVVGFGFPDVGLRASGSWFTRWGLHQGFRDQASELIVCITHGEKCLGFRI